MSFRRRQLFELGSSEALPGYGFKEFAGDRAALFRGVVMYRFDRWKVPVRITRRLWPPSPSPALSLGVQAGWTDISTHAARLAVEQLDVVDPNALALSRDNHEVPFLHAAAFLAGDHFPLP